MHPGCNTCCWLQDQRLDFDAFKSRLRDMAWQRTQLEASVTPGRRRANGVGGWVGYMGSLAAETLTWLVRLPKLLAASQRLCVAAAWWGAT